MQLLQPGATTWISRQLAQRRIWSPVYVQVGPLQQCWLVAACDASRHIVAYDAYKLHTAEVLRPSMATPLAPRMRFKVSSCCMQHGQQNDASTAWHTSTLMCWRLSKPDQQDRWRLFAGDVSLCETVNSPKSQCSRTPYQPRVQCSKCGEVRLLSIELLPSDESKAAPQPCVLQLDSYLYGSDVHADQEDARQCLRWHGPP